MDDGPIGVLFPTLVLHKDDRDQQELGIEIVSLRTDVNRNIPLSRLYDLMYVEFPTPFLERDYIAKRRAIQLLAKDTPKGRDFIRRSMS